MFILNKREIKIYPLIVVDCAVPLAFIAAFCLLELEQTDLAISCLLKKMADFTGSLAFSDTKFVVCPDEQGNGLVDRRSTFLLFTGRSVLLLFEELQECRYLIIFRFDVKPGTVNIRETFEASLECFRVAQVIENVREAVTAAVDEGVALMSGDNSELGIYVEELR